jgi:hypothetical protein
MNKFYIIFKNGVTIEGETLSHKEIFTSNVINPLINEIDTYQFWSKEDAEADFYDDDDSYLQ